MEDTISSPVIDKAAGIRRVGGDEEFYEELIELFMDESDRQIKEIHVALASDEADSIEKLAHSIKGAASNVGALQVQNTAYELERLGRENKLENAEKYLNQLMHQLDSVRATVKADS